MLKIEICPQEPRATIVDCPEQWESDILDCTGPGDAESACRYVLEQIGVEFWTIARNASGQYENRKATKQEIENTCTHIYFDSESDFSDMETAALYLIWEAANNHAYDKDS
jgi:hypothetical protein